MQRIVNYILITIVGLVLLLYDSKTVEDYKVEFKTEIFTIYSNYYLANKMNFNVDIFSKEKIDEKEYSVRLKNKKETKSMSSKVKEVDEIYLKKEKYYKTTFTLEPKTLTYEGLEGEVEAEFISYDLNFKVILGYFMQKQFLKEEITDDIDITLIHSYKDYKKDLIIDSGINILFNKDTKIKSINTYDNKIKLNIENTKEEYKNQGDVATNYNPYLEINNIEKTFLKYKNYYIELSYEICRPFRYISLDIEIEDNGVIKHMQTKTEEINIYHDPINYKNYFTQGVIYNE